jgi:hypothetical protein
MFHRQEAFYIFHQNKARLNRCYKFDIIVEQLASWIQRIAAPREGICLAWRSAGQQVNTPGYFNDFIFDFGACDITLNHFGLLVV